MLKNDFKTMAFINLNLLKWKRLSVESVERVVLLDLGFFGCTGSAWVMGFREKCDTLESGEGNWTQRGVMDWWECWEAFFDFRASHSD